MILKIGDYGITNIDKNDVIKLEMIIISQRFHSNQLPFMAASELGQWYIALGTCNIHFNNKTYAENMFKMINAILVKGDETEVTIQEYLVNGAKM